VFRQDQAAVEMTLIAALRIADGVILASDSQQTRGRRGRRLVRQDGAVAPGID
jgi:20S proteasome alpha/beta subunit